MVVSAFPGTGKSYFYNKNKDARGFKVVDSDSSKFSWISEGVRNPNFVTDYCNHIEEKVAEGVDIILVSSHQEVREELARRNIPYKLVYPERNMKILYKERFMERGSPAPFIKLMDDMWDKMIDSCEADTFGSHIVIGVGETISEVV